MIKKPAKENKRRKAKTEEIILLLKVEIWIIYTVSDWFLDVVFISKLLKKSENYERKNEFHV